MQNSPKNSDLQDLTRFLTPQERGELEQILAATPEPVEIVFTIVRPDKSIQAHLLRESGGGLRELSTDEIATRGLAAPTPEVNNGFRRGE